MKMLAARVRFYEVFYYFNRLLFLCLSLRQTSCVSDFVYYTVSFFRLHNAAQWLENTNKDNES